MDVHKEPIRADQNFEFPLNITNGLRLKPGVIVRIGSVFTDEMSWPIKLIIIPTDPRGHEEGEDAYEFDTYIDLYELSFDHLVDVGSFIKGHQGMTGCMEAVIDRSIASMLADLSYASFSLTDTDAEPSGEGDEDRMVVFSLKLGGYYDGEVVVPWDSVSKYFDEIGS